jgi:hypothetical protein
MTRTTTDSTDAAERAQKRRRLITGPDGFVLPSPASKQRPLLNNAAKPISPHHPSFAPSSPLPRPVSDSGSRLKVMALNSPPSFRSPAKLYDSLSTRHNLISLSTLRFRSDGDPSSSGTPKLKRLSIPKLAPHSTPTTPLQPLSLFRLKETGPSLPTKNLSETPLGLANEFSVPMDIDDDSDPDEHMSLLKRHIINGGEVSPRKAGSRAPPKFHRYD